MNSLSNGRFDQQRIVCHSVSNADKQATGMTKREAFAMAAMQGMAMRVTGLLDHEVANAAVRLADAMLFALEKPR
ncbi:hypothetical protein ACM9XA_03525 [Xanthomonas sacchari]